MRPEIFFKRPRRSSFGDRGPPFGRVQPAKFAVESSKNLVDDAPDQSQWMVCGHSLFEIDIGKQITCPYIRTAHGFLLLLSQQYRNQIRAPVSLAPQFFSSLLILLCHK